MSVLPGQRLGSLIAGVFGLIYVEVNAGALRAPVAVALRIGGTVAFVGLVTLLMLVRRPRLLTNAPVRVGFGRGYWLVVGAEVVAIVVGSRVLTGPLNLPDAVVAWVSVVVGVHFVALAAVWRMALFHWLGAAITLSGITGLVAASDGATKSVIATVGGVVPGALLLVFGYWGAISANPGSADGSSAAATSR